MVASTPTAAPQTHGPWTPHLAKACNIKNTPSLSRTLPHSSTDTSTASSTAVSDKTDVPKVQYAAIKYDTEAIHIMQRLVVGGHQGSVKRAFDLL